MAPGGGGPGILGGGPISPGGGGPIRPTCIMNVILIHNVHNAYLFYMHLPGGGLGGMPIGAGINPGGGIIPGSGIIPGGMPGRGPRKPPVHDHLEANFLLYLYYLTHPCTYIYTGSHAVP